MDFRILAESIPHKVWSTRPDGYADYQNDRFLRYIGKTMGEILGFAWVDIIHPEDRQRTIHAWTEALAKGQDYCIEHRIRRAADGCYLWHESRAAPLRDHAGNVERWFGTSTEIEERKRTAEALDRHRDLLQKLFDNTCDGLYVKDLAGRYLLMNPIALKMVGKDAGEVIGRDDTTLFPAEMHELVMGSDRTILETGTTVHRETPVLLPTGETLIMNVTKGPLRDSDGKIFGIFGISRDVTAYKKAEQLLLKSESRLIEEVAQRTAELEANNRKLRALTERIESAAENERQLIGQEVHDELGQLLTVLKFNCSWLKKNLGRDRQLLTEKFTDNEKIIDLALSSVQRISRNLRPRILDDLGIVAAIQAHLNDYRSQGLVCRLRVIGDETTLDPARSLSLFRIYQEGMTNVLRHACANRGRIILVFAAEQVRLRISDNGRGISVEQINNPHSLGILGMRERALRWGGSCLIRNRPGGGTRLDIEFLCGAATPGGPDDNVLAGQRDVTAS